MQISVIIPALNEARHISHTLSCLQSMRQRGHEVIVVDGGSHDNTLDVAALLSDTVIQTGKGSGIEVHRVLKVNLATLLDELNIKDISVDGMKAADRKEEQRRVQFVATLFDWGRLILAVLTLTLLLIAVGFSL